MKYYCIHCKKVEVEEEGQETLHGNTSTPASNTEIEITFRCRACQSTYWWDSSDSRDQTLCARAKSPRSCGHCAKVNQINSYRGNSATAWCSFCDKWFKL
jgi:hypothetical protein